MKTKSFLRNHGVGDKRIRAIEEYLSALDKKVDTATEVIDKDTTSLADMKYGKMYLDEENGIVYLPLEDIEDGYNVVEVSSNGIYINTSDGESTARTPMPRQIPIIDHQSSVTSLQIEPDQYHRWGEMASLTISLETSIYTDILHEYMFEFTSGTTPTTLSLPANLLYGMKGAPTIKANTTYEFHIQQDKVAWEAYPLT